MNAISRQQKLFDSLAIGASTLCLIHCLVLPAALIALPALAAFLAVPEEFHLGALLFAAPISALALAAGYHRHHKRKPAAIALIGLASLGIAVFATEAEWLEAAITVAGSLLLAFGHALNWRTMRHPMQG